ncbi:PAS domain-containing protein, partial [Panaeolus papilionaceus]
MYSSTGFDVMGLLSRVVMRKHKRIDLGPVDMSCSFVVVDVRRHDSPIVYASKSFLDLTGYAEEEVIGRNCRFLQGPPKISSVMKGAHREHTSNEAVAHLRKHLLDNKECQATLMNYRRDGTAFMNLVSVIPVQEDDDEVAYHVGFQVDLAEQPQAILEK